MNPRTRAGRSASISGPRGLLLAALSGVLLCLAFPSARLWPLVFVALVPLLLVIDGGTPGPQDPRPATRSARWGPWLAGIVFYALLFWWLVRLPAAAMTHPWVIFPALLVLAAYLGLFVALFGFILRFVRRRIGWSPFVTAPAAWAVSEWLKSSGPLGCPWGNIGYALAREPAWIQSASVIGATGLTIWIVTVNALLAGAIRSHLVAHRALCLVAAVGIVAAPVGWGAARLRHADGHRTLTVALVQPDIRSDQKWNPARQELSVATLSRLTMAVARQDPKPDLIVWPETALPFYVRLEPAKLMRLFALVRQTGVPLLLGYPDAQLTTRGSVITHNSAGLVLPNGTIAAQYDKIHLVPFGERIPFQSLFPFLGRIDLGQAEWTPGDAYTVFSLQGTPFSVLICFESIFPGMARRFATEGARFLVNITNDEWFGPTAAPWQHSDMAILRCVELGMGMARCANTGVSMFIDSYGRVTAETALFREATLTGRVQLSNGSTLYARWGDALLFLCIGLVSVLMALAWYRPLAHLPGR
jgi:apolipoprotein N-acyltransferase